MLRAKTHNKFLYYTEAAKCGMPGRRATKISLDGGYLVSAAGQDQNQCASPPSNVCIASQSKRNQLMFYALDPDRGLGAVPLASSGPGLDWSLSPDGQQIALIDHKDLERVQLLLLERDTTQTLELGKWSHLSAKFQFVRWFANGEASMSLILPSGTTLLSVGVDGRVSVLSQGQNWLIYPIPAPNGKLLGYSFTEIQRDLALIENL